MKKDKTPFFIILAVIIVSFVAPHKTTYKRHNYWSESNEYNIKYTASELEALGKNKAKDHIRNKYGFDAEIEDYSRGSYGSLDYRRECLVTMNYEGEKIYVLVDGYNDNAECSDSYQAEEIRLAVEKQLGDALKDYSDLKISVSGQQARNYKSGADSVRSGSEQENDRLYHEYFNGNNLKEVLSGDSICIFRYCVKCDISGNDIPDKAKNALPGIMIEVFMYSYDTPKQAASKDNKNYREMHSVTIYRNGEIGKDEYQKFYSSEE